MSDLRSIAVVTGTRAEFGLLSHLMRALLRRSDKVLVSILYPSDRPAKSDRGNRDCGFLRIKYQLWPKSAANVWRYNAYGRLFPAEQLSQDARCH